MKPAFTPKPARAKRKARFERPPRGPKAENSVEPACRASRPKKRMSAAVPRCAATR
jgi:hypothetical protein